MGFVHVCRGGHLSAPQIFDFHFNGVDRFGQGHQPSHRQGAIDLEHDDGKTAAMKPGSHTGSKISPTSHDDERR
jgi:hypothetical protein